MCYDIEAIEAIATSVMAMPKVEGRGLPEIICQGQCLKTECRVRTEKEKKSYQDLNSCPLTIIRCTNDDQHFATAGTSPADGRD